MEDRALNMDSILYNRTKERSMLIEREKDADHKRYREKYYDKISTQISLKEVDKKFTQRNRNYI
jgi:hypothetical protein